MKFKALKDFYSPLVNAVAGETYDVELDKYTLDNWTENGLIEEIKTKKASKKDPVEVVTAE